MITEDHSIACSPGIALRSSVKIEFDKILWGRRPKGRATQRRGGRGGGRCLRGRKRSLVPKDGELRGRAS
jgi:hypothetical protein